jgi:chloramphenicol-sensitive protein RarD
MDRATKGAATTIVTFFLWGLFPIYWKSLRHVEPAEILAHRVLWSFLFVLGLFSIRKYLKRDESAIFLRTGLWIFTATACLIGANWLVYIWTVNTDRIVEASLGYFINPLVSVLLGVLFLRERLSRTQNLSLVLASIGLLFLTWSQGRVPWAAIALACTLASYGLLRKIAAAESMQGLLIETAILTPFASAYIVHLVLRGSSSFGTSSLETDLLLMGAGLITAITLLLFVYGARRLQYSTVGFMQYLIPTIQLIVGVFVYKEPFAHTHSIAFGFVWVAIILYSTSSLLSRGKEVLPR